MNLNLTEISRLLDHGLDPEVVLSACARPCGDIGEAADPYVPTPPRLVF